MKQRTLTGIAIVAVLILVMAARQLTTYIFDAFILGLALVATYEMSNIMAKGGLYNNKYFAMAYPILAYALYLVGIFAKSKPYIMLVIQIGLIVVMLGASTIYSLLATKTTKNEIETRNLKLRIENFSVFKAVHTMFIYLYPGILMLSFILLNNFELMAPYFVKSAEMMKSLSLFAIIVALIIPIFCDTFAYLTGSLIKGPKLCPKISPNKTISGAIGGFIWGTLAAVGVYFIFNAFPQFNEIFVEFNLEYWHFIILGVVCSIFSQLGDLFESYLKRKANVKDSGNLLAGHGGILDRMDSHIFCAPIVFIFFIILL